MKKMDGSKKTVEKDLCSNNNINKDETKPTNKDEPSESSESSKALKPSSDGISLQDLVQSLNGVRQLGGCISSHPSCSREGDRCYRRENGCSASKKCQGPVVYELSESFQNVLNGHLDAGRRDDMEEYVRSNRHLLQHLEDHPAVGINAPVGPDPAPVDDNVDEGVMEDCRVEHRFDSVKNIREEPPRRYCLEKQGLYGEDMDFIEADMPRQRRSSFSDDQSSESDDRRESDCESCDRNTVEVAYNRNGITECTTSAHDYDAGVHDMHGDGRESDRPNSWTRKVNTVTHSDTVDFEDVNNRHSEMPLVNGGASSSHGLRGLLVSSSSHTGGSSALSSPGSQVFLSPDMEFLELDLPPGLAPSRTASSSADEAGASYPLACPEPCVLEGKANSHYWPTDHGHMNNLDCCEMHQNHSRYNISEWKEQNISCDKGNGNNNVPPHLMWPTGYPCNDHGYSHSHLYTRPAHSQHRCSSRASRSGEETLNITHAEPSLSDHASTSRYGTGATISHSDTEDETYNGHSVTSNIDHDENRFHAAIAGCPCCVKACHSRMQSQEAWAQVWSITHFVNGKN